MGTGRCHPLFARVSAVGPRAPQPWRRGHPVDPAVCETDARSVKTEIATFAQVFPDTTLWNPDMLEEGYDLVALGRVAPALISQAAIDQRIAASLAVQQSLAQVSLPSAASILSTYAGRGADLAPWLVDAEINRERHLRLQYWRDWRQISTSAS